MKQRLVLRVLGASPRTWGYDNDSCHNNVNPQINLFFMVTFRIKSFLLKLFLSRPGFNAVFVGLNFLISGIEPGGYT